jgi:hypothetical protein
MIFPPLAPSCPTGRRGFLFAVFLSCPIMVGLAVSVKYVTSIVSRLR